MMTTTTRLAVRTLDGLRMFRRPDGNWGTEDGRYSLAPAPSTSYCENPHPMRERVGGTLVGSYCPGGASHPGPTGWRIEGDHRGDWFDTQTEAWFALAQYLREEATR
jgi:hypothetical protein